MFWMKIGSAEYFKHERHLMMKIVFIYVQNRSYIKHEMFCVLDIQIVDFIKSVEH